MKTETLRVRPGSTLKLRDWDTAATYGYTRERAEQELLKNRNRLAELQEVLYAQKEHALLIILQGMDAGGKDGTIRHVMSGANPLGCSVNAFKAPTEEELGHDFLWRVHKVVPVKGQIGVFNRSHYEDVLVVRVHKLVPKPVWSRRYDDINDFEDLVASGGVKILKFFLHISKQEQKRRLQERIDDPTKRWKVNPTDFNERRRWSDYMAAYEDALSKCSAAAPWYIIPSDRKWFRNLAISQIVVEALEGLKLKYPKPTFDPAKVALD